LTSALALVGGCGSKDDGGSGPKTFFDRVDILPLVETNLPSAVSMEGSAGIRTFGQEEQGKGERHRSWDLWGKPEEISQLMRSVQSALKASLQEAGARLSDETEQVDGANLRSFQFNYGMSKISGVAEATSALAGGNKKSPSGQPLYKVTIKLSETISQ